MYAFIAAYEDAEYNNAVTFAVVPFDQKTLIDWQAKKNLFGGLRGLQGSDGPFEISWRDDSVRFFNDTDAIPEALSESFCDGTGVFFTDEEFQLKLPTFWEEYTQCGESYVPTEYNLFRVGGKIQFLACFEGVDYGVHTQCVELSDFEAALAGMLPLDSEMFEARVNFGEEVA